MPEVHTSFKTAGQKAGLEIWRIENFLPVPIPRETYGKFYSGDSYIVLKPLVVHCWTWASHKEILSCEDVAILATPDKRLASAINWLLVLPSLLPVESILKLGKDRNLLDLEKELLTRKNVGKTTGSGPNFNWDIHFWLGKYTSQDESGAAAILTVNLDDYQFNGAAVQHRETQGYESKQFMDYFPPAIRYLEGGHASGFSHVTVNAGAEKRLFHIKGKKHVRVRQTSMEDGTEPFVVESDSHLTVIIHTQVEATAKSMNKGDCFILDVDHTIYVFVGEKSSHMEKLKANSVAVHIRDQDHNGRGHIEIIDPYSSGDDTEKFFTALGSGSIDTVPDETEGGDDEEFEHTATEAILSEISDRTGVMKLSKLPKPLKKSQLDTKECYILDNGSRIYVWVGKMSNDKEKSEAMRRAEEYMKMNDLPSWVHVSKVPEGMEPVAFKQYFSDWK